MSQFLCRTNSAAARCTTVIIRQSHIRIHTRRITNQPNSVSFPNTPFSSHSSSSSSSLHHSSSLPTCSVASLSRNFIRHSHIRQFKSNSKSLRPMLDLRHVRDNVEQVQKNIEARGSAAFANALTVKNLYEKSVTMEFEVARVRKERNQISKKFGTAKTSEDKAAIASEGAELKARLVDLEAELDKLNHQLENEASRIPNTTSTHTPIGPEGTGRVIAEIGTKKDKVALDHLSFCQKWHLVDLESASIVSGSRFYYLQHELALLELALVQYAMHKFVAKGFTPILPPDLVKTQFVTACGFQPRDAEGTNSQVYHIDQSELSLVGTAEIPIASMYAQRELNFGENKKPIKHVAFGHAFRTEAGGQGLAIKGLYRVHQFSKVELFALCTPEQSEAVFDEIVELQREFYSELGLSFRVLEIPSEDLGAPAHRKIDCEAWMPGRGVEGSWGEISSTSNCTDYQSRRLGIRYSEDGGKDKKFVHTLNGTAAAIPRLLISIIEQHQSADGKSVSIPEVLRPFMMGIQSIPDRRLFPDRKEQSPTPAATPNTKHKSA